MAVLAAGAIAVPINLRWSFQEAQGAVDSVGAEITFIDEAVLATFGGLARRHGRQCIILGASTPDAAMGKDMPSDIASRCSHIEELKQQRDGARDLDIRIGADGAAMICFTSGTSGAPKGAVLSHAALHAQVRAHARSLVSWMGLLIALRHTPCSAKPYTLIAPCGSQTPFQVCIGSQLIS